MEGEGNNEETKPELISGTKKIILKKDKKLQGEYKNSRKQS